MKFQYDKSYGRSLNFIQSLECFLSATINSTNTATTTTAGVNVVDRM